MPLHLSCLPTTLTPPHLHNTSVFLVYHVNNVCLAHPGPCSTWSGRVPPAAVYRGVGQQLLKLLLGNQTIVSRLLQAVCSLSVCSAAQRVNSKQQTAYSPLPTCESFVSSGKPLSLSSSHTLTPSLNGFHAQQKELLQEVMPVSGTTNRLRGTSSKGRLSGAFHGWLGTRLLSVNGR